MTHTSDEYLLALRTIKDLRQRVSQQETAALLLMTQVKEAVAAMRERCALIAYDEVDKRSGGVAADNVAKAIRALSL